MAFSITAKVFFSFSSFSPSSNKEKSISLLAFKTSSIDSFFRSEVKNSRLNVPAAVIEFRTNSSFVFVNLPLNIVLMSSISFLFTYSLINKTNSSDEIFINFLNEPARFLFNASSSKSDPEYSRASAFISCL